MKRFAAFAVVLALWGCGDDSSTDGGVDMNVGDIAMPADLSGTDLSGVKHTDLAGVDFAGVSCGAMTCGAGDKCCVRPGMGATCGTTCDTDGGIPTACDGPEDCSGSTCCADVVYDSGNTSGQASCVATCSGSASYSIGSGAVVHSKLCHNGADCTGYTGTAGGSTRNFDLCCRLNAFAYGFCAPAQTMGFPGVTCD